MANNGFDDAAYTYNAPEECFPKVGIGGCNPRPIKDKNDSTSTANAKLEAANT